MKITETLFEKRYVGERLFIPISDLPSNLLIPENNIMINVEQGYNDNNGWNEGETTVRIIQHREQTEEEKKKFRDHIDQLKLQRKEERYKQYLKLKKEFQDEIQTNKQ